MHHHSSPADASAVADYTSSFVQHLLLILHRLFMDRLRLLFLVVIMQHLFIGHLAVGVAAADYTSSILKESDAVTVHRISFNDRTMLLLLLRV